MTNKPSHHQNHLVELIDGLEKMAARTIQPVGEHTTLTETIDEMRQWHDSLSPKRKKKTTWTNGPDDTHPHPTIDDVEPKGRLITSPGPLYNPMPLGVEGETKIGSQHTNWYKRLMDDQRANVAKLREEGVPEEIINQTVMPKWLRDEEKAARFHQAYAGNTFKLDYTPEQQAAAEERVDDARKINDPRRLAQELNEEYFNAYPHLRPEPKPEHTPYKRRPPQELTEAQIESSMAKESTEIRRLAMTRAASGDVHGAQLMMLHALFAQQTESEERLSKRLDRPKFNTRRRPTQTDMEEHE